MEQLVQTVQDYLMSCKQCQQLCHDLLADEAVSLDAAQTHWLRQCVAACGANTEYIDRESPSYKDLLMLCAEACRNSAEVCEGVAQADALIEECHQCAALCEMVAESGATP